MLSRDFNRIVEEIVAMRSARCAFQKELVRETAKRRKEVDRQLRVAADGIAGMRRAWRSIAADNAAVPVTAGDRKPEALQASPHHAPVHTKMKRHKKH